MSHINLLHQYREHDTAVEHLLASIVACFADAKMFDMPENELQAAMKSLCDYYPFLTLFYLLDSSGYQVSCNIGTLRKGLDSAHGYGADRSQRPYYRLAANSQEEVRVTEPYFSSTEHSLCVSAIQHVSNEAGAIRGYVVLDIDLKKTLEFLSGDSRRTKLEPWFKLFYSIISVGLFLVVLLLLSLAFQALFSGLFDNTRKELSTLPFTVVVYFTLALAIYDLGKTVLEEEVLLHKDVLRHSSTRRTITRFIAAIIIAVCIEALLMIFKSALYNDSTMLAQAVWALIAGAVLLVALGIYIYLGSRAEIALQTYRESVKSKRDKCA